MQLVESSIYIGLKRLRDTLYHAQFLMDKAARVIYGRPIMEASGKTLACFTLAFDVKSKRLEYLEECMGWYAVLRTDIDFCIDQNIIHYERKKPQRDKDGKEIPMADDERVSAQKVELYKLIARIDNDISKWRASLVKGKVVTE